MKRLVFIGDSITDCDRLWDERPEGLGFGFVRMIYDWFEESGQAKGPVRIFNRGNNGFTAFQVKAHLEEDCLKLKPDVVTLLVGINDLYMHIGGAGGFGAEVYGRHLEAILQAIKEKNSASVILMEPFVFPRPLEYAAWEEPLGAFRNEMRRLAKTYETGFLPLSDYFQALGRRYSLDELTVDGIHLTEKGHELLAAAWISSYMEGTEYV